MSVVRIMLYTYVLRGDEINLHLKAMAPFRAVDLLGGVKERGKRTSVGCPLWRLPAVNTWLVWGLLTFILILFSLLHLDRILSCRVSRWRPSDGCSLGRSRSRWFFERERGGGAEHREPELSDLSSDLRSGSRAALIA